MRYDFKVDLLGEGKRLDQYLSIKLPQISRSTVKKLLEKQGATVNGKLFHEGKVKLKLEDQVQIEIEDAPDKRIIGEDIPFEIIYEDDDLLVINKEAGIVVHPGAGNKSGTLVHALVGKDMDLSSLGGDERPGIVHRLDKDTSGLILVAKNDVTHRKLSEMFSGRHIRKTYLAIVQGRVEHQQGEVEAAVGRHPHTRTKMAIDFDGGRDAVTQYEVLERFRYSTYLKCHPLTGRTHQIRVHMLHIGHPVLGDPIYGRKSEQFRLALHAAKLEFEHPTTGEMLEIEAPLPKDFAEFLETERNRTI